MRRTWRRESKKREREREREREQRREKDNEERERERERERGVPLGGAPRSDRLWICARVLHGPPASWMKVH